MKRFSERERERERERSREKAAWVSHTFMHTHGTKFAKKFKVRENNKLIFNKTISMLCKKKSKQDKRKQREP